MSTLPHVITLTSPGRSFALDAAHVSAIRQWMAENLDRPYALDPIAPEPVGFQAGGVVRFGDDADAFYFHMKWSDLVSRYCVYEEAA